MRVSSRNPRTPKVWESMNWQKFHQLLVLPRRSNSLLESTQLYAFPLVLRTRAQKKSKKCTLKNDEGRFRKEDAQKIVQDTEKDKAEDVAAKEDIGVRNGLENYGHQLKNTVSDKNRKVLIGADDMKAIVDSFSELLAWMDENLNASKDTFAVKQKSVEEIEKPIMAKMYRTAGVSEIAGITSQDG